MSGSVIDITQCVRSDEEIIEQVVDEWLKAGKAFTAFDVTIESQKLGVTKKHVDIKRFIHETIATILDTFSDGSDDEEHYDRSLIDVGAPEQAFLYHPVGYNINSYEPMDRDDNDPKFSTNANNQIISVHKLSKCTRDRLYIPAPVLTQMGLNPGDTVHTYHDPADDSKTFFVGDQISSSGVKVLTYTVEASGCVRISPARMSSNKEYKLEFISDDLAFITEA